MKKIITIAICLSGVALMGCVEKNYSHVKNYYSNVPASPGQPSGYSSDVTPPSAQDTYYRSSRNNGYYSTPAPNNGYYSRSSRHRANPAPSVNSGYESNATPQSSASNTIPSTGGYSSDSHQQIAPAQPVVAPATPADNSGYASSETKATPQNVAQNTASQDSGYASPEKKSEEVAPTPVADNSATDASGYSS